MKKRMKTKLTLHRETLRLLTSPVLTRVAGLTPGTGSACVSLCVGPECPSYGCTTAGSGDPRSQFPCNSDTCEEHCMQ